jgi:hypothetical protein
VSLLAQLFSPLVLTSLCFKTFPFSHFLPSFRDQQWDGMPFVIVEHSSQFSEKISFSRIAISGILDQGRRECIQVELFMLVPESPMIDKGIKKLCYMWIHAKRVSICRVLVHSRNWQNL